MASPIVHDHVPEAWDEDAAYEEAAACCGGAKAYLRDALARVEGFITREPLKAVLIAAGVGFLAGVCNLRRR